MAMTVKVMMLMMNLADSYSGVLAMMMIMRSGMVLCCDEGRGRQSARQSCPSSLYWSEMRGLQRGTDGKKSSVA